MASPAWCYATLFMGHGLSAGCLMIAFAAAVALGHTTDAGHAALAWTVGLFCGWAVVSEFPAAVPVVLIVALAFVTIRARRPDATAGVLTRVVAGGALPALVLLAYNTAAFGSPFHLGYASEEGFEQLHTGLFGITLPSAWRVREILIGGYRGLLPISPLVALTPIGLALLARTRRLAGPALVAAAIAVFYLAAQRVVFLLGRRMGIRPAAVHAGAAVSRARPGAALGSVGRDRARRARRRLAVGHGAHARRGVDDAAAACLD